MVEYKSFLLFIQQKSQMYCNITFLKYFTFITIRIFLETIKKAPRRGLAQTQPRLGFAQFIFNRINHVEPFPRQVQVASPKVTVSGNLTVKRPA